MLTKHYYSEETDHGDCTVMGSHPTNTTKTKIMKIQVGGTYRYFSDDLS